MDWDGGTNSRLDKKQSPYELDLGNLDPTEFEPTVWPWEKLHVRPSKKVDAPDKKKIHWVLAKNAIPLHLKRSNGSAGIYLTSQIRNLPSGFPIARSQLDFPFQLTPRLLSNIQFDPAGNLILCLDEGRIENRLVIDAERIPCRLAKSDLGSFDDPAN